MYSQPSFRPVSVKESVFAGSVMMFVNGPAGCSARIMRYPSAVFVAAPPQLNIALRYPPALLVINGVPGGNSDTAQFPSCCAFPRCVAHETLVALVAPKFCT